MFESKINRGKANGYAPLDSEGKVPLDKTYVGANGTSGTSGLSGTSGIDGTNGLSGTSGIDGTNGLSGTNGVSGTSGTSALVNTNLIFTDNTIEGDYINAAGIQITIATDKDGGVNLNGNGILVPNTYPYNIVQIGWVVRFFDGTVRTVIASGTSGTNYWIIQIDNNVNLEPAYPLTVESPDYQIGDAPYLELKVSGSIWTFDDDGILKLNNGIGELYADPNDYSVRIGTADENVAPNEQIILGGPDAILKIKSGPPLREWTFAKNGDFNLTGSINGASNLATTGSNVFKGQQIISGSFNVSISANAFGVNENPIANNIFWSYIPNDTNTTSIENGWVVNIETVGIYNVTNVEYDYPFVKITLDDGLLELPYRCNGYFSLASKELKFGTDGVLKISGSLSVSGSITGSTNFNTIVNKPTLISGSSQLTSSLDTRYAASGSAATLFLLEAYANETYTLPGGFTDDTCRYSIVNNTVNVPSNWFNTSTYRFTPQKAGYWQIIASYDIYRNSEASLAIRKNGGVVAAAGTFNSVAQQITKIVYLNGSTDYIDVMNTGGGFNSRAQFDSRSWFQAKWIGQ